MDKRLTFYILIGMVAGIIVGYALNLAYGGSGEALTEWADMLKLLPDVFLNLIKMIIAPLVLATVITGITHMGDASALGRIGGRALAWFIIASLISLGLGLLLVNIYQPGVGLTLTATQPVGELATGQLNLREFVLHVFPKSAVQAMAENSVLQILVFSLFAGIALSAIGEKGAPILKLADALVELMLQITNYVMRFAPFAVFGALAAVVATKGLGILVTYGRLILEFYSGLVILWAILFLLAAIFLQKRAWMLFRYIREPILLAFSTASSEAALPKLFEQLDRFGVPRRISGFMLPMGYSFNLDGSMMYMAFATIFIAQAYGIELDWQTQGLMLLTMMVTSKGIAAVPRASLVVIAATLSHFNLPTEGIALVLAIDQFLDMGRTATNVVGNAVATSVMTKWEGMLQEALPPDGPIPHAPTDTPDGGRKGLNLDPTPND